MAMSLKHGGWLMSHDPLFSLTVPSDLRCLEVVRQFVEAACGFHGFADFADGIVLAAHEALQNVIRHAHRGRPGAIVLIECGTCAEGFFVTLADDGEPFDVATVPRLDPAELRIGGRGVFLMRSLMDELTSRPRHPHGNVLRMVKGRPAMRLSA